MHNMSDVSPHCKRQSEYLCTLQPTVGSTLARELQEMRTACWRLQGCDATGLYPPHVSVSGFFTATSLQATALCSELMDFIRHTLVNGLDIQLRKVVSTSDGHVLFDVAAIGVTRLATTLSCCAGDLGVFLRPKAVRHLSLASGRSPVEQERIAKVYESLASVGLCQFDLVVSKLVRRSNLDKLQHSGEAHEFKDVFRSTLPVSRPGLALDYATLVTPMRPVRKRNSSNVSSIDLDPEQECTHDYASVAFADAVIPEIVDASQHKRTPAKLRKRDSGSWPRICHLP